MTLPQLRAAPWYPGQMGVPGSDVPRGLRTSPAGIVLYVSADHPNATATADGTDPENPLSTITAAAARLLAFNAENSIQAENSVIVIGPGTYAESVAFDATNYPDFCTILGGGNGQYATIWAAAAGDCLTIDAYGWLVEGIHFQPAGDGAGVKLTRDAGAGAEGTVIHNCFFNGLWGQGLYGVELEGTPANVSIINCRFAEFDDSSQCITETDTSTADVYQMHVIGCTFQESDEYISRNQGGYNQCVIKDCVFVDGTNDAAFPAGAGGTAVFIDLRGGSVGYNTVVGCSLGGDYSNTGGYFAGTADNWMGNSAFDIAEAEVGDNAWTIAVPAA